MERIKKYIYESVIFILFLLLIYVTYCSIFNIYQPFEKLNPLIIIIGTVTLVFFLLRLYKLFDKIPEKRFNLIAISLCIIFLFGLIVIGSNLVSIPLYDLSHLQETSLIMIENGGKLVGDYFLRHPHQIPSTIIVYLIYSIGTLFKISRLRILGTCVNAIFIALTAFFTYLSAKEISNPRKALIALIFFIINPVFYLFVSYFYTDTLCMPFSAISIYLFIKAIKSDSSRSKILFFLLSGLFVAIGYKIRVVVAIFLIAIIVGAILNKKLSKKIFLHIIYLLAGFIVGLFLCKLVELPFKVEKNKDMAIPATHYIMMGLNDKVDGFYNQKDYNYTRSKNGYNEKIKGNVKQILKRLKKLGIKNIFPYIGTKLRVNWSNGEYYNHLKYLLANVEEITNVYHYTAGTKRIFSLYFAQICKSSIMILVTIVVINELKNRNNNDEFNQTILISIFGAFVFYILWEVKPRYSLTFLPWFILAIPKGITTLENAELLSIKIPWQKIIAISSIAISIFFILLNINKYAIDENIYCDRKVHQERQNKRYKLSKNNIKQIFYTDKKFNCIQLRFFKKEKYKPTTYAFKLLNSEEKVLYETDFSSNALQNYDSNYSFYFDTIEPQNKEKFFIQIYSKNATDNDSVRIALYSDDVFDVYPDGYSIINNEKKNVDIVFSVQEKSKRTYINKEQYILLVLIILVLEFFSFYPYLEIPKKELN